MPLSRTRPIWDRGLRPLAGVLVTSGANAGANASGGTAFVDPEKSAAFYPWAAWIAAAVIAIVAATLYVHLADWPWGTHPDEAKKARFIISWEQDFHHPLLLLQPARIANYFLGYTDPNDTLRLGRIISAIFGGLTVFGTFVLGRLVLAPATALAASAAVSVTPLIAIHATFLKEDIYLTAAALFGMAALLTLIKRPNWKLACAVGMAMGAATSAKLVGGIFLVYTVLVILVSCRETLASRARLSAMVVGAAILTFFVINASALIDFGTVLVGLDREVGRGIVGDNDVRLPIWLTGGVMHLRDSLLPGLGLPLLALGLAGLFAPTMSRTRRTSLAIIAGAAILWYLAHEIAPLKIIPNIQRFVVPDGPLLVILAAAFLETVVSWRAPRYAAIIASAVLLLAAAPAAYATYRMVGAEAHDPRRVVPGLVGMIGTQSLYEKYVAFSAGDAVENPLRQRSRPLEILVTSSFQYERYVLYGNDPSQSPETHDAYERYERIFHQPYLELSSGPPSFGFLNPVIRIVALDGNIDRLGEIGQAVIKADPHIQLRIGP
jgi:Dolichyl-phosphate-mannose-protein mannosyltransferase